MSSDDDSQGPDRHHDEHEWEAQKENFYNCYIVQNMPRKKAVEFMKDQYGFDATPRQWERKIKQWRFFKYSSREERLQQINDAGQTVDQVSKPGRRPRAQSGNSLQVDRNLRRFARRELSRSRSRPRSASYAHPIQSRVDNSLIQNGTDSASTNPHPHPNSSMPQPVSHASFNPNTNTNHSSQLNYLHPQTPLHFDDSDVEDTLLPTNEHKWSQSQPAPVQHQYGTSSHDAILPFSDNSMPHQINNHPMGNPHLPYMIRQTDPSAEFAVHNPPVINNVIFPPYDVSASDMTLNRGLSDPSLLNFNPDTHDTQVSNSLDSLAFDQGFAFQLNVVDTDTITDVPIDDINYQPIPNVQHDYVPHFFETVFPDPTGPLEGDINTIVRDYTQKVRQLTLSHSADNADTKLANEAQLLTLRLKLALESYTKTQQRALQDVRSICASLREKNSILRGEMETLKMSFASQSSPDMSGHQQHHRASTPNLTELYH
ncbi:hypothetical protein PV10_03490 [Exophiala mesophila]|uniref:Clr5 domain-containing protein n=1 Tax=Exophiala mesophila TaxID=212818 RepID=A0A0D1ZPK1_EXOME|nr:uncharacterized protein PV10_03490 [Exophiala mesophila]KIV95889.1 hypothetical protein PV10_03490 [Exophiala mesophila]